MVELVSVFGTPCAIILSVAFGAGRVKSAVDELRRAVDRLDDAVRGIDNRTREIEERVARLEGRTEI